MLTDLETMVLASVQVFMAKKELPRPVKFGSGFTINYRDRTFFISVSHVTDHEKLTMFLETNIPFDPKDGPKLKPIGEICYFDLLNTANVKTPEGLEELLNSGRRQRLDISFALYNYNEDVPLLNEAMDFGPFKIPFCEKLTLEMSHVAEPSQDERYGFYGKIKPKYFSHTLIMTPTLKNGLTFQGHKDDFYVFISPEIIKTKNSYAGCSGAPILDSKQRLVAIACAIGRPPSRFIYGFPIQKCRQLIDYAIDMKMLS